ncbi:MoaB/Mog domain-containing protein [Halteromyces radiatus]|uniref:MoaB/Mog domain-containing protein n=1 Tax=Halteromyces radiatus TaxID=101107 RepID=UPI00221FC660|nr:MoaB/Mog domain-containing protein [Halteromyces radiatus]KAI8096658.1 MoaB/Mog domain-containing protein [Halteromyces radiatus]
MTKTIWTASCLVIGDEILSGKTQDTNSYYLAQVLFQKGIELQRIEVVPDDQDAIAESVKRLSTLYDFVFTSGGIGTHDDITYASIAKAFELEMQVDDETWEKVRQLQQHHQQHGAIAHSEAKQTRLYKQMATFPIPSEKIRGHDKLPIPVVVVNKNVYILPGIPRLFQLLLDSLSDHINARLQQQQSFHRRQVATKQSEIWIADILSQLQKSVQQDQIKIGSYPTWNDSSAKVIVSIVGKDIVKVDQVTKQIMEHIDGWIIQPTFSTSRL